MGKFYLASMRLFVTLFGVGAGLTLSCLWLGLISDDANPRRESRRDRCRVLAIQAESALAARDPRQLAAVISALCSGDGDLVSIGLRDAEGTLHLASGGHAEQWARVLRQTARNRRTGEPSGAAGGFSTWTEVREQGRSVLEATREPVSADGQRWGQLEVCFAPLHLSTASWPSTTSWPSTASWILHHGATKLLALFFLASLITYLLIASHINRLFRAAQVVPDRVRQALDTLAEGLLILDESECIVLANTAFAAAVNLEQSQLIRRPANRLPWVRGVPGRSDDFPWVRAIREGVSETDQLMRYAMPDESHRIFSINSAPIVAADGSYRGALATFRDVTHIEQHRAQTELMLAMLRNSRDEISRKNAELEILAMQDALTGCLNRRAFFDRLEDLWQSAADNDRSVVCAMLDLDHFKQINDTHGHPIGDEVLRQLGNCLRKQVAEGDLVCRYGGEEFCLVLVDRSDEEAVAVAERIRATIGRMRLQHPAELRFSASIGVASRTPRIRDPQELIERADRALYIAKHKGRNRVLVFDAQLQAYEAEIAEPESTRDERPSLPFQAVTALVTALAHRDAATAEHSRRVADLCVLAADDLLDHRQTYILEIAALLHDIGKIGVPDEVLLKPGPLTRDEWQLMSRHDRIGIEIVSSTFASDELSEIIGTQRAFFGGRNDALHLPTGTAIPAPARLLSIANSYDSIVSDHLYGPGRTHEEAVLELRRCAGIQFDPQLVEHFVNAIERYGAHSRIRELEIPHQTALQIGQHIERLAEAVDRQDRESLRTLASRLGILARQSRNTTIAALAEVLAEEAACVNAEWVDALRTTRQLLDLCGTAQTAILNSGEAVSVAVAPND